MKVKLRPCLHFLACVWGVPGGKPHFSIFCSFFNFSANSRWFLVFDVSSHSSIIIYIFIFVYSNENQIECWNRTRLKLESVRKMKNGERWVQIWNGEVGWQVRQFSNGRTPLGLIAVSKLYDCCTAICSCGVIVVWFVVWLVWFSTRIIIFVTRFNHVVQIRKTTNIQDEDGDKSDNIIIVGSYNFSRYHFNIMQVC